MKKEFFNKSQSFMLPSLGISYHKLEENGFIESYLGDYNMLGNDSWGDYICLLFNSEKLTDEFREHLEGNEYFYDSYYPEPDKIMLLIEFPEDYKQTIVQPFLEGKYSKINRQYVNQYYKPFTMNEHGERIMSRNWMILHKHDDLRKEWENILDMNLPDDAEVWSRPTKYEEVYNFEGYAHQVENLEEEAA